MVRRNTGIYKNFAMLMIFDLRVFGSKLGKDLFALSLFFLIVFLRFVTRDLKSGLVTLSPRRQKDDRRQQIETAQSGEQFWRWNVGTLPIHCNNYSLSG